MRPSTVLACPGCILPLLLTPVLAANGQQPQPRDHGSRWGQLQQAKRVDKTGPITMAPLAGGLTPRHEYHRQDTDEPDYDGTIDPPSKLQKRPGDGDDPDPPEKLPKRRLNKRTNSGDDDSDDPPKLVKNPDDDDINDPPENTPKRRVVKNHNQKKWTEKRWDSSENPKVKKLGKRGETCAAGKKLCPESLKGGCCPLNYECAVDSCTSTVVDASTMTACGKVGYFPCAAEDGGGCCPVGLICGAHCDPPEGTSTTCPPSYILCPASLNYGCCQEGFACGSKICSPTAAMTGTFTSTFTVTTATGTDEEVTVTEESVVTTVWTPTAATSTMSPDEEVLPGVGGGDDDAQVVVKFFPSTVAKEPSFDDGKSSSSGSLSKAAIGGLVAGGVALVVLIALAVLWIHFRLRHNEKVVESEKRSGSGSGSGSRTGTVGRTDYMAVGKTGCGEDEGSFMGAGGGPGGPGGGGSEGGSVTRRPGHERGDSLGSSSRGYGQQYGYQSGGGMTSPDLTGSSGGAYHVVPTSAVSERPNVGGLRHPSMDSTTTGSYFDHHNHRVSGQTSVGGYRYSVDSNSGGVGGATPAFGHGRQWSNGTGEVHQGKAYVIVEGNGTTPQVAQELDGRQFLPELPSADGGEGGVGDGMGVTTPPQSPRGSEPSLRQGHGSSTSVAGLAGAAAGAAATTATEINRRPLSTSLGSRPPLTHQTRKRSDSLHQHHRGRSDSSGGLGVLSEHDHGGADASGRNSEERDREILHGFYGPADRQVGQTAAGLRGKAGSNGEGGLDAEGGGDGGSSRNSFSVER